MVGVFFCWRAALLALAHSIEYQLVFADFGVEHSVPINGLDSNTINSKLEELVKKGESMPRSDCCLLMHLLCAIDLQGRPAQLAVTSQVN